MTCVVIVDMRQNNGQVCALVEDDQCQWLALFPDFAAAEAAMADHLLGQFPRLVLDLDSCVVLAEP